jgi:hypothetical protein
MSNGEDWLWRPVLAGMIKGESLIDGSIDLEMVATANEALDVQNENDRRLNDG